jgi:hypothetical protein
VRDLFVSHLIKTLSTVENYGRGLDLFIEYAPAALGALDADHHGVLVRFVRWLQTKRHSRGTGYSPASIRLYVQAVRAWFEWMNVNGYLPAAFSFEVALYNLRQGLKSGTLKQAHEAPEPPQGIDEVITYYDKLTVPPGVAGDHSKVRRWAWSAYTPMISATGARRGWSTRGCRSMWYRAT